MNHRLLLSALLFAGCATPNPLSTVSSTSPLEGSSVSTDDSLRNDPVSPMEGAGADANVFRGDFSLELAMDIARANAIEVLRAADAHLAATAELRIARTDTFYPHIFAGAQTGRVRGRLQATDGDLVEAVDKENANVGIGLRFGLDLATATHGIDAARESLRATSWDWAAAELAAETAAALLYHDLLEAGARVDIAESAVDRALAYHALAEARFQAGDGLEVDVLRGLSHLAEARQQRVEALAARGRTSTLIAELLGLDPLLPLEPTDSLEPRDLVGEVAELNLATHPALEASRARVTAMEAKVREDGSRWYLPELILDAGFNDFGEEFGDRHSQESLTAAISWDLSPSIFAHADRSHAALLRAKHDEEAETRRIESSLVRAQISALATDELLEATLTRVDASRAAVSLERTRHEAGDALLIELLDAEVSLLRAETAHAAAICSYNRAQHLLRQALGG